MDRNQPSDACLLACGLKPGPLLYENPLAQVEDIADWCLEGPGACSFPQGRMRLESTGATEAGQKSNLVFWCPEEFPDRIRISWDFYPLVEPGLAILFFAARGRGGVSVLDPSLAERHGPYDQYHHGDIDALHVSYFRRRHPDEIQFHTCNLRKSYGFHLVTQGGDPIPCIPQANPPYRISVIKDGPRVVFCIDQLVIFDWHDDGSYGDVLTSGHVGFRQMNPLIAEYADLRVEQLS